MGRSPAYPHAGQISMTPFHIERQSENHRVRIVVRGEVDVLTGHREQRRLFVREQGARAAAEEAERRSAFLADAGPLLDASLDLRATLESLTRLSVPFLGDVRLVD